MTATLHIVNVELDELWLDPPLLCRMAGVSEDWLRERVLLGLLRAPAPAPAPASELAPDAPAPDAPEDWRFNAADLRRVRRIALLERDFDAVPELAALVADLEDELADLRAQLQRQARPLPG